MTDRSTKSIQGALRFRNLTAADASAAGRLLAASHANYPAFRIVFDDPTTRPGILERFMRASCRDAARHGLAVAAEDELGIVGVALWMPPGTFPLSARRKLRMVPAMIRIWWRSPAAFPTFARVGSTLEDALPRNSGWYLQAMGVHPRAQRAGIGRQLLARGLSRADDAGLPCHLHTSDPDNVAYYRRFGFDVVAPEIVVSQKGPRYIAMSRPPADRAAP